MSNWWEQGNDLALVDAILKRVRDDAAEHGKFSSHLVGAARVVGLSQEEIEDALYSDRGLVIYEP